MSATQPLATHQSPLLPATAAAAPAASSSLATAAPSSSASASALPVVALSGGYAGDPMTKYGTHECTCDGCSIKPIVGLRYKCTKCRDHDICESCYGQFEGGVLPHMNKLNPLASRDVSAHAFCAYMDARSFSGMAGVKKAAPAVKKDKCKPNEPCSCKSGKKYKKCCGAN